MGNKKEVLPSLKKQPKKPEKALTVEQKAARARAEAYKKLTTSRGWAELMKEYGAKLKKKLKKAPEKNKTLGYVKENLKGEQYFQNYFNRCVERATGKSVGELLHGSDLGRTRLYYIWKNAAEYWSKNHPDSDLRRKTSTFNGIENWDPVRQQWRKKR